MDARSDLYSLGVLLFEMATGRRPFTGDEPGLTQTGTTTRLQEAHLRLPPPEPRSLNPKLPAAASTVILRALAKRPADRWPDAVSLREAWEAAVGVTATAAGADAAVRAAARPTSQVGRRPFPRWTVALVGIVLLAATAAVALASRGSREGEVVTQATAPITIQASATVVLTVPPPTARPVQGGGVVQVGKPAPETATRTPTLLVVDATAASIGTPEITAAGTTTDTLSAPGEPTLVPTLTRVPTKAPATPTPRLATPRPAATAQPSPSTSGGVTLLRPPEGEKIVGSTEFAWQNESGFALRQGEQYELIIWGLDENPLRDGRSPVGASDRAGASTNLADAEAVLLLTTGRTYFWGVRLLSIGGRPIRMLSNGRKFTYDRPSSGGGSQPGPPPPPQD